MQALTRGLGSPHVDHRLQQLDFSDDAALPIAPGFAAPQADYAHVRALLLVGSHPRHDVPLLGHRIRRAWKHGAQIHAVNPLAFDHHFSLNNELVGDPAQQVADLAAVAAALAQLRTVTFSVEISEWASRSTRQSQADAIARSLHEHEPSRVLFGDHAVRHPSASLLRRIARFIADTSGSAFDEMPSAANGAAAWRVGCVPHRGPGASAVSAGSHALDLVRTPRRADVLYGAEAPEDFADGNAAAKALGAADYVLAFAAFAHPTLQASANVILPIGLVPEIDGSYVNVDGTLQAIAAGAKLPGDARAGWRVLRALGAALNLPGFEFNDFATLHAKVRPLLTGGNVESGSAQPAPNAVADGAGLIVQRYMSIYRVDPVVRRAPALQSTVIGETGELRLNPEDALALGLGHGGDVSIGGQRYACTASPEVPRGVCRVSSGFASTAALPATGARIQIERVNHG